MAGGLLRFPTSAEFDKIVLDFCLLLLLRVQLHKIILFELRALKSPDDSIGCGNTLIVIILTYYVYEYIIR